ncbi:MAG: hypothetical protein PHW13_08130 [Methylococcales bacterium]|nr:hypothetical protein [Methylococcales bacterium]
MIRKNVDLIIVALITTSLILYDVTFELLEEFFHLLFEVLHNLFEWVELGVEEVVEFGFHFLDIGETVEYLFITERHGSQVVTFYFLMGVIGYGIYKLAKFAPGTYRYLQRSMLMSWIRRKTQCQLFWHSQTQIRKVILLVSAASILLLLLFIII